MRTELKRNHAFTIVELPAASRKRAAFTIVELLTVVGIIAILLALMMPTLVSARRNAQAIVCASNMRNLSNALTAYASQNRGYYPANIGALNLYWYNRYAIGSHVKAPYEMSNSEQCIGSVFVCPSDLDGAVRSYSMNVYASAAVSVYVSAGFDATPPIGKLWKSNVGESTKMILLIESFSMEDWPAEDQATGVGTGITGSWSSKAVVGLVPNNPPVARFFSGGPTVDVRFGQCASEVSYFRHRAAKQVGTLGDATGRLNIAFADGHVELLSNDDLYTRDGQNTFRAMWSPNDREIEQQYDAGTQ